MNFKSLNGVWKLKTFLHHLVGTEFFFNFDFQMHKTHLESFAFEILFLGDYSSTFYLFDDESLKYITFLASLLGHFEKTCISAKTCRYYCLNFDLEMLSHRFVSHALKGVDSLSISN